MCYGLVVPFLDSWIIPRFRKKLEIPGILRDIQQVVFLANDLLKISQETSSSAATTANLSENKVQMLRFTLVLLFLAIAIPASAQTAATLQGAGQGCDSVSIVAAPGVAANTPAARSLHGIDSSTSGLNDSFASAEADIAGSSAAAKMLFLKKICWLPFRRATYS